MDEFFALFRNKARLFRGFKAKPTITTMRIHFSLHAEMKGAHFAPK